MTLTWMHIGMPSWHAAARHISRHIRRWIIKSWTTATSEVAALPFFVETFLLVVGARGGENPYSWRQNVNYKKKKQVFREFFVNSDVFWRCSSAESQPITFFALRFVFNEYWTWVFFTSIFFNLTSGVKRNFLFHAMCACTKWYSPYQIRRENWLLGLRV